MKAAPRIVQPDVLVLSNHPLARSALSELTRALPHATIVTAGVADVTVAGQRARLLTVTPSDFRRFTPPVTAQSTALWQRVSEGNLAASFGLARRARLALGSNTTIASPLPTWRRIGAFAAFGIPGVDGVLSSAAASGLAVRPDSVVLISGPAHDPARVAAAVHRTLPTGVTVSALHTTPQAAVPTSQLVRRVDTQPATWKLLYQQAASTCQGLPWQVLAAIGTVESGNGSDVSTSYAGAMGPMQFLPSTWASYGVDADRNGRADIMDPVDAVYSAARYLCDNGVRAGQIPAAIYAYNHADWYVREVLQIAGAIR